MVLFHLLDPEEIRPKLKHPVMFEDLETGETMEVTPDYAAHEYRDKMAAHMADIESRAKGAGLDYFLVDTGRPSGRRAARVSGAAHGEVVNGFFIPLVPGRRRGGRAAHLAAPAEAPQDGPAAVSVADVFREARAELGGAPAGWITSCCSSCAR